MQVEGVRQGDSVAKKGRKPKVGWSESRRRYECSIRGVRHNLGKDEDEATDKFNVLMEQDGQGEPEEKDSNPPFAVLADAWLEFVKENHSADRYRQVVARLEEFIRHVGKSTRVDELRPSHIKGWIKGKGDVTPGTHRLYAAHVLAVLNWAAKGKDKKGGGLIPRNPLRSKVELPEGGSRGAEFLWSEEVYSAVIKNACREFADVIRLLRWVGCRPSLACRLTAAHYNPKTKTLDVASLGQGKKLARRIWLPQQARELVERLVRERPEGPLFLNKRGRPWCSQNLQQYLTQLTRRCPKVNWPEGFCVYSLRHLFATEFIARFPDKLEYLREQLGHKDLNMIRKHYSHLYDTHSQMSGFLDELKMPAD
jgi:integrase